MCAKPEHTQQELKMHEHKHFCIQRKLLGKVKNPFLASDTMLKITIAWWCIASIQDKYATRNTQLVDAC